jgi:hypothetical protein
MFRSIALDDVLSDPDQRLSNNSAAKECVFTYMSWFESETTRSSTKSTCSVSTFIANVLSC